MSNYALNRLRRLYMAAQTDPLTLPSSITNTNYCLFSSLDIVGEQQVIRRPDITGSRQDLIGLPGRHTGTWSVSMSLAGSGSAGTAPDCDPLLQAIFGAANTAVASTSNTYSLSDNIITCALYHYRHAQNGTTALTQQISMGSTVTQATFSLGSDIATLSANGRSIFVLDSDNWSAYTGVFSGAKGGLSAFPSEPSSPVFHGVPVVGFTGSLTTDSNSVAELKSMTIKVTTGNQIVDDTFGQYFGSGVQGDFRTIDVSLTLDDSDSAAMLDLKQKAFSFAPINIVAVCGTTAGNTWTFNLNQVQMVNPKFSPGPKGRMRLDFNASVAHGTTLSGLDAFSLALT
ncbi:MAG TPA: hypothetical protein VN736_01190 [Candidatus Limnocylindrales bacterium]|nr:hypothetical protein [Candidatus Limnocylindrales bacterium]